MHERTSACELTAVPTGHAAALRATFQLRTAAAIEADVEAFERATGIELAELRQRLRGLDPSRAWRPELYFAGGCLVRALRAPSIDGAVDALARLRQTLQHRPYATACRVESVLHEGWEHEFMALYTERPSLRHLNPSDRPHARPIVDEPTLAELRELVARATDGLREISAGIAEELDALVCGIRLFRTSASQASFSTLDTYGLIFIGIPYGDDPHRLEQVIEAMVHEVAHVRLNTLMYAVRFVDNDDDELFSFPTRPDRQPMRIVFHTPFVYARILHVLGRLLERSPSSPFLRQRFERTAERYRRAHAEVAAGARLTPAGQRFFDSLGKLCSADATG